MEYNADFNFVPSKNYSAFRPKRRARGKRGGKKTTKIEDEVTNNDIVIVSANARGMRSKITSIRDVANKKAAKILCIQETNLKKGEKVKIPNFSGYFFGTDKQTSGIATMVHDSLKALTVKVAESEEEDEEFTVLRLDTNPGVVLINSYLTVESRKTKEQIREGWERIAQEMTFWDEAGDAVMLTGDMNAHVGNDEWGIPGNHEKVSARGKEIRDLLMREEKFVLLNASETTQGGPATRFDPSNNDKWSALDMVICNRLMERHIKLMRIDSDRNFSFKRVRKGKKGVVETHSDHVATEIILSGIKVKKDCKQPKQTSFNFKKPGGWQEYRHMSNQIAPAIEEATRKMIKKEISVDQADREIKRLIKVTKEISFGYSTATARQIERRGKGKPVAEKDALFAMKTRHAEKEIDRLEEKTDGAAIQQKFWTIRKELGGGKQKGGEQAAAVQDPCTGELVTRPTDIRRAHAEHVRKTLESNPTNEENEELVGKREKLHEERMVDTGDRLIIKKENFEKVVNKIKGKNKAFMRELVRAGDKFRDAIWRYTRALIRKEKFPKNFQKTECTALYKGKGSMKDLSSYRYIHCKHWLARLTDLLVVSELREDLLESVSPRQCGGMPGRSTTENIFCLKTAIGLNMNRKTVSYASFYDLSKFFDKESIADCAEKMYEAGIRGARYRCYHKLQSGTMITVKTAVGKSDEFHAGAIVGQGAAGAALSSAQAMDRDMENCMENCDGFTVISPISDLDDELFVKPLIYQDDIQHVTDSIQNCTDLHARVSTCFNDKGLTVNSSKCSILVVGKGKPAKEAREYLTQNPILTMGEATKVAAVERYLGEYISQEGLKESVSTCLREREPKIRYAVSELLRIIEDPRCAIVSPIKLALAVIDYAIKPAYLYGSDTWINISKGDETRIDNMQSEILRKILGAKRTVLKAGLLNEAGMIRWSDEVKAGKLRFAYRLERLPDRVEAKRYWIKNFSIAEDGKRTPLPNTLAAETDKITIEWGLEKFGTPQDWTRGDEFYKMVTKTKAEEKSWTWVNERLGKSKTMNYPQESIRYEKDNGQGHKMEKTQSYLKGNLQAARLTFAIRSGQLIKADTRSNEPLPCDCGKSTFNTKHITSGECEVFGQLVDTPPQRHAYAFEEGEMTPALWLGKTVRNVLKAKLGIEKCVNPSEDEGEIKFLSLLQMSRGTKEYLLQMLPKFMHNPAGPESENNENLNNIEGVSLDEMMRIADSADADQTVECPADMECEQEADWTTGAENRNDANPEAETGQHHPQTATSALTTAKQATTKNGGRGSRGDPEMELGTTNHQQDKALQDQLGRTRPHSHGQGGQGDGNVAERGPCNYGRERRPRDERQDESSDTQSRGEGGEGGRDDAGQPAHSRAGSNPGHKGAADGTSSKTDKRENVSRPNQIRGESLQPRNGRAGGESGNGRREGGERETDQNRTGQDIRDGRVRGLDGRQHQGHGGWAGPQDQNDSPWHGEGEEEDQAEDIPEEQGQRGEGAEGSLQIHPRGCPETGHHVRPLQEEMDYHLPSTAKWRTWYSDTHSRMMAQALDRSEMRGEAAGTTSTSLVFVHSASPDQSTETETESTTGCNTSIFQVSRRDGTTSLLCQGSANDQNSASDYSSDLVNLVSDYSNAYVQ